MSLCTDGLGGSRPRCWGGRPLQEAHLGLISGGVPRQRPPCRKQLDRIVGKQSLKAAVTDRRDDQTIKATEVNFEDGVQGRLPTLDDI